MRTLASCCPIKLKVSVRWIVTAPGMTACTECRWYKYGKRQKRIFFGYTAFAALGLLFLAMIIGFIYYGLHTGDSNSKGNLGASANGFMVISSSDVLLESF